VNFLFKGFFFRKEKNIFIDKPIPVPGFSNTLNCCPLKRILLQIIPSVFFCFDTASQGILDPSGARYLCLGTYSIQNVDVYATRNNAASLAQLKLPAAAVYSERRFMMEDLTLFSGSVALTTGSGNFAIHGTYFGFELSNQTQLTLSYGRKLSAKADIGASFHYNQVKQAGIYGTANAITGSVGVLLHLTEKLHAGVNAYNPIRASYDKQKEEHIPAQYNFGMGYDVSEKLFVSAELVKTEGCSLNVNAGIQYRFIPQFFIKAGIATLTSNYYAGLGFNLKRFRLDIATSYHPQLGLTPGLMLLFEFKKQKDNDK
jgi:hypothetical protein